MKIGVRKPNIKNSIKARTTGKAKRLIKKSVNPLYGKKGMGFVNNPKKAVYNKIYHKTTFSATSVFKKSNNLLYIIFIALPLFLIIGMLQILYYCCKYFFLGGKWIVQKIINLIKKNKEEEKKQWKNGFYVLIAEKK